ncbi:hypothetical protein NLM27_27620 [Bradyrhizobium sp. CCGB12]|uniref:hypothetical protein n=1 Tax=Bradyrhizobium sp. CCGB12 TaxID=2949632 RepID=UPI0020B26647|nr:hypothetical protein [Bradyrhizobium sp. CCGB12]MCP3392518.1 hypothetical protein [Bradyrhizobium sp. CCGB12]
MINLSIGGANAARIFSAREGDDRTRPVRNQKCENNPMHSSQRILSKRISCFQNFCLTRRAKQWQDAIMQEQARPLPAIAATSPAD